MFLLHTISISSWCIFLIRIIEQLFYLHISYLLFKNIIILLLMLHLFLIFHVLILKCPWLATSLTLALFLIAIEICYLEEVFWDLVVNLIFLLRAHATLNYLFYFVFFYEIGVLLLVEYRVSLWIRFYLNVFWFAKFIFYFTLIE